MKLYHAILIILFAFFLSEGLTPELSAAAQATVGKGSVTAPVDVMRLFVLLETEPDRVEEIAREILKINPSDRAALTALAWYHLRNDRYEEAYRCFSELNRIEPDQTDHLTGMIYAMSGMKNLDKVMALAPEVNSLFYNGLSGSWKK